MARLFNMISLGQLSRLVICLLFVVIASTSIEVAAQQKEISKDLSLLCANSKQLKLRHISQIKSLAEELKSNTDLLETCPNNIVSALLNLEGLILLTEDNVCSLESTNRIRNYFEKYVTSPTAIAIGKQNQLPEALTGFFLGYGLVVSKKCRQLMISTLLTESHQRLNEHDSEMIDMWTSDKSGLTDAIGDPESFEDLLWPRDISQIMKETSGANQNSEDDPDDAWIDGKVYMHLDTDKMVEKLQRLCKRRYKPIYEQLIMPQLYLANVGFSYITDDMQREFDEPTTKKEINQWYRIMFLCESLETIELVDIPDNGEMDGTDVKRARVLSPEEAAAWVKQEKPRQLEDEAFYEELFKFQPQIVYEFREKVRLEDEILVESDKNLMKLVRKFDTRKSETERFKERIMAKLFSFVANKFKKGELVGAFKSLFGFDEDNISPPTKNPNVEVFKVIDRVVSNAYNPDRDVAGRKIDTLKRFGYSSSLAISGGRKAYKKAARKVAWGRYWLAAGLLAFIFFVLYAVAHG